MLPAVVVALVLLAYYALTGLSYGFFQAAYGYEHPYLSRVSAIVWPLGWSLYGAYVLFIRLERVGARMGNWMLDSLEGGQS